MPTSPRANRGPGAASENRAALVSAARSIFADRGIDAPLSAVARQAGVGQGSLYRHFPTRSSLAVAVFEENVDTLEDLARDDSSTLGDILRLVTEQAIVSTALFEMIEVERADDADFALARRVSELFASKLPAAHATGTVPPAITTGDIQLAVAMVAGALAKVPRADRHAVAAQAWALLPFGPA